MSVAYEIDILWKEDNPMSSQKVTNEYEFAVKRRFSNSLSRARILLLSFLFVFF